MSVLNREPPRLVPLPGSPPIGRSKRATATDRAEGASEAFPALSQTHRASPQVAPLAEAVNDGGEGALGGQWATTVARGLMPKHPCLIQ